MKNIQNTPYEILYVHDIKKKNKKKKTPKILMSKNWISLIDFICMWMVTEK